MAPFRLTVLGPPELRTPDGDPVRVRTRKHVGLLVFLAVEAPGRFRRDRLATMFWPDVELEEARHSLAQAMSSLRLPMHDTVFDTERDSVWLHPGLITTDLAEVEEGSVTDEMAASLRPFLEEFEIDDATDFDHWKDAQRARILPLVHQVMGARIAHARRHGDAVTMSRVSQALMRIDDLNETAALAQLEAGAMSGDRIGALRNYDRWRERLSAEIGARPATSIDQMADRLRRHPLERRAISLDASVRSEQWKERIFLGRATEFAACRDAWQHVLVNSPRHVLLRGETGIGKTTLMDRFATAVVLEGAAVARAKCYELERELPFGMIGGLVNQLLDLPGISATPPEQLAEVGRVVLKVRQRYPHLPAPIESIGETARLMFTEGIMAMIAAVADEQPLLLMIDDIHMADATSLAVLHLAIRRSTGLPLMVALTSSSALQAETPEARRFADNTELLGLSEVHLGPLSDGEAEQLLAGLLDRNPEADSTVRRALLDGARGNPMVLELLVADWQRQGKHCVALSLRAMTTGPRRTPELAFRRVVDHTLAALDPEARAVAELAAILGQRLNDLSMYTMVDLPLARTMRAMTALTSHRILRDAGTTLEFASEFVRGQCYISMAASLRQLLHGAVADKLLARHESDEPIPGLEIAWQLVRADRLTEAVPYLIAGGRESIRRGAAHEAEIALRTGLPALTGPPRRTAILLLAEAQQELGYWSESLQLLEAAAEPFDESEACCRDVFLIIAKRWLGRLTLFDMAKETDKLLEVASSEIDIEVRVKALAATIRLLNITQDESRYKDLENRIEAVSHIDMDVFQRLHLALAHAWMLSARGNPEDALAQIEQAVTSAEGEMIRSSIVVRLLIGQGCLLSMSGRYADATEPMARANSLATRLDNKTLLGECSAQMAVIEGRLGQSKAQVEWGMRALTLFGPVEVCAWTIGANYEVGLGQAAASHYQESLEAAVRLEGMHRSTVPFWLSQGALLCAADVCKLCGNERKAYALGRRATRNAFESILNKSFSGQFARWVALIGVRDHTESTSIARIRSAFPVIDRLDAKDQAEVLGALAILEESSERDAMTTWKAVDSKLGTLPPGIRTVMRRLGTLNRHDTMVARQRRKPRPPRS